MTKSITNTKTMILVSAALSVLLMSGGCTHQIQGNAATAAQAAPTQAALPSVPPDVLRMDKIKPAAHQ